MPARSPGEPLNKFIARFLSSKSEKKQFPKVKQRLAVGYSEARERAKKHG